MSSFVLREDADPSTLELDRDARTGQLGPNHVAYLVVERGPSEPGATTRIEISGVSKTIGRDRAADVVMRDASVSRTHAKVGRHPDGFVYIEDLGSKNGVYVNRQRCDVAILRNGDVVEIGKLVLSMAIEQAPADAANDPASSRAMRANERFPELSPRQREVALLASEGRSNAEIAAELDISIRTVSTHLENIYGRLGVSSRLDLVKR
jgi:DNA-binding CsgD family transcriptional regulator